MSLRTIDPPSILDSMKPVFIAALMIAASSAFAAGRTRSVRPPVAPSVPLAWSAPACQTTSGLPGFYFTLDEGRTVSSNDLPDPINSRVLLATTDVPNRLIAILEGGLYESWDSGCRWFLR